MALSLQEQLLKAGLTNKKKANQVRQQKNKQVTVLLLVDLKKS